jgi:CRP-like cAMP-binding protein
VKRVKHGETNKVLMLEEEILFNQGDAGDKAYMVVSGRLAVIVDKKEVGYMGNGEVFGELALLLNQKRSATVKSLKPTELIEIDRSGLDKILNSASSNVKSMILDLCEELSKRNEFQKIPFSVNELNSLIEEENDLITKFARQIFYRLDKSTSHVE